MEICASLGHVQAEQLWYGKGLKTLSPKEGTHEVAIARRQRGSGAADCVYERLSVILVSLLCPRLILNPIPS